MKYLETGEPRTFSLLKWLVGLAMGVVLIGLFLTSDSSLPDESADW